MVISQTPRFYRIPAYTIIINQLTGDLAPEASRIAKELCINIHASKASPQEKQTHIQALQSQGHSVAMVRLRCVSLP
jgi:cation transport ATPase